ncbi:MAG TPA: ABC transporter permease [Gaiellaceae bacterium]|nr:ABC transporter permease [Gaiellaceae bacterium]
MSEKAVAPPPASSPETVPSVAARLAFYQRAGGIITPVLTAVVAFIIGGLVILVTTGKDPISTYQAIFKGSGLGWLSPIAIHWHVFYPNGIEWTGWDPNGPLALNLQQTLILVTPLILTGLAVAFAFRCGLFNIGGNGQYLVGAVVAIQFGIWFSSLPGPLHVIVAIIAATLAGAAWAGIAGILKATVGAHEVITTIMLNWIALWVGSYLVGFNGPMQDPRQVSVPVTRPVANDAHLHVIWGSPLLQGLHIGIFIALAALVLYWLVLNRTTLGYEVRAVGFNAEAARYGGISVARNYSLAMAISGAFAGLAGAVDMLGWQFQLDLTTVQSVQIGFLGIAVALLGRNTALGVFLSAILFGALLNGTSTRNLDPSIFKPELAGNLTQIIQGLVVLFVGADLLIIYLWQARRRLRLTRKKATEA